MWEGPTVVLVDRSPKCVTVYLTIELIRVPSDTKCWMYSFSNFFSGFNFPSGRRFMKMSDQSSNSEEFNRDLYLKYIPIDPSKYIGNYIFVKKKKCGNKYKAETVEYTAMIHGVKPKERAD